MPEWANYGALGLMVIALLTGAAVPGYLWRQERKRAEEAEQRERDMARRWEEKALPLLAEASRTVTETMVVLRARREL